LSSKYLYRKKNDSSNITCLNMNVFFFFTKGMKALITFMCITIVCKDVNNSCRIKFVFSCVLCVREVFRTKHTQHRVIRMMTKKYKVWSFKCKSKR